MSESLKILDELGDGGWMLQLQEVVGAGDDLLNGVGKLGGQAGVGGGVGQAVAAAADNQTRAANRGSVLVKIQSEIILENLGQRRFVQPLRVEPITAGNTAAQSFVVGCQIQASAQPNHQPVAGQPAVERPRQHGAQFVIGVGQLGRKIVRLGNRRQQNQLFNVAGVSPAAISATIAPNEWPIKTASPQPSCSISPLTMRA